MKGIMFIEPLYNKVVDKDKTQTRRIIDIRDCTEDHQMYTESEWKDEPMMLVASVLEGRENNVYCRYCGNGVGSIKSRYNIGESIYLKEPYFLDVNGDFHYKYGHPINSIELEKYEKKWKNKMFMPERAARRFIMVTARKAERVADISEEDAIEEGVAYETWDQTIASKDYSQKDGWFQNWDENLPNYSDKPAVSSFKSLWNSINGKFKRDEKTGIYYRYPFDGESSDVTKDEKRYITIANPWVFAYGFKLIEKP